MASAQLVFHAELNDFLPNGKRGKPCSIEYASHQTLKHLIESVGVPHVEVKYAQVDGLQTDLDHSPPDGSLIDVFPGHTIPQGNPRFVLDIHLGRLAAYLRMYGIDTLYRNDFQDQELAEISSSNERILLTRDRRLLMRKVLLYGYCIRHLEPLEQLGEVLAVYQIPLPGAEKPQYFTRCLRCNSSLEPVSKESVLDRLQPLTKLYYEEFKLCPTCNQVYWKGSHVDHMQAMLRVYESKGKCIID